MSIGKSASVDSKDNAGDDTSAAAVDRGAVESTSVTAIPEESIDKTSWPQFNIKEPHINDVLYGRGGGTNHHPGNKRYREMVEYRKLDYVNSKRLDKPLVALDIIKEWRMQDPPGRFLKMDDSNGLWNDVGDKKAREKTSQALREKAPQCRKQDEIDYGQGDMMISGTFTRFNVPPRNKVDLPLTLQRDHSLGRDILEQTEQVGVQDFSWGTGLVPESRPDFDFYKGGNRNSWTSHTSDIVSDDARNEAYDKMTSPARIQRQHLNLPVANPPYTASMPHQGPNGWSGHKSAPVTPVRSSHVAEYAWPPPPVETAHRGDDGVPAHWVPAEHPNPNHNHIQLNHDHEPPAEVESYPDKDCGPDLGRHHYAQVVDILHDHDPVQRTNSYPDHYHHGEDIPVEYDKWASPSRAHNSNSDGGRHTPRHSNTYDSRPVDTIDHITVCDPSPFAPHVIPSPGVRVKDGVRFGGTSCLDELITEVSVSHPLVSPASETSSSSTTPRSMHRRRRPNIRNHGRNSPARQAKSYVRKSAPFEFEAAPYYQPDSPSNRMGNSTIPKPPPVKRDTSNQNENSETKRSVKKMNRQKSIGNRPSSHLDKVSEKEVTSLGNSLEQSSLEHGLYTHGQSDQLKDIDTTRLERPEKMINSSRSRTCDSFDFAIDNSIGIPGNLEEPLDLDSDAMPLSVGDEKGAVTWRQTSFPFPENDSPEDNRATSSTLSGRPVFLSNGDRLSSLGSIEGNDIIDGFVNNTGSVEAN